jgi:hypothetical protein
MDNLTGRNLDWYWREWVYSTARLDQAVDSVLIAAPPGARTDAQTHGRTEAPQAAPLWRRVDGAQPVSGDLRIVLANRREMVMPAELKLFYDDGSSEVRKLPVEIWLLGSRYAMTLSTGGKRMVGMELDPRHVLPDVDRRNNRWGRIP